MWEWAKEVLTQGELNNMFPAKDRDKTTARHMTSKKGQLELLHNMWEWVKQVLTPEELNNNILLANNITKRTTWYVAAENDQLEVLHKFLEWTKEVLTT